MQRVIIFLSCFKPQCYIPIILYSEPLIPFIAVSLISPLIRIENCLSKEFPTKCSGKLIITNLFDVMVLRLLDWNRVMLANYFNTRRSAHSYEGFLNKVATEEIRA